MYRDELPIFLGLAFDRLWKRFAGRNVREKRIVDIRISDYINAVRLGTAVVGGACDTE